MASVASQLIEEVTAHGKVTVSRIRERYAQTVLTFRITYVRGKWKYCYIMLNDHRDILCNFS